MNKAYFTVLLFAVGCDDGSDAASADTGRVDAGVSSDAGLAADAAVDAAPVDIVGRCEFTNPFSMGLDCKAYTGAAWTLESAQANCDRVIGAVAGEFTASAGCAFPSELGSCAVGDPAGEGYVTVSSGDDASQCGLTQTACENFAQGDFTQGNACMSDVCEPPTEVTGQPFIHPYEKCEVTDEGEVCTPVIISGCTEEGRDYAEFGQCEDVLTQRPYAAYGEAPELDPNDARLADGDYMAELAWVTQQVESCACGCCHKASNTPQGPSLWDTEAGPLWIDMVPDNGLAMLAGLSNSDDFGAVPPDENNGFDRSVTGVPTTDVERMQNFLVAEYMRRGNTREQGEAVPPFGGPLYTQQIFEPQPCARGEGITADGTVNWVGGEARYIYVLETGSANPGVPPNLDVPEDTRWLVDVDDETPAMACDVTYGTTPSGARERVAPAPLNAGDTYYLYVLRDIGLPLTRCTFEYPID